MEDELKNFLRERKARVADDKASLQQDLPYMELKSRPQRTYVTTVKENIPPKTQAQGTAVCESSVGLPLGLEYEKKKQKLQQELRMDYRHYITQVTLETEFGLQRRRDERKEERKVERKEERREAAVETDFPLVPMNVKTVVDKATPAPELPRVAFQSPILGYSSALGLGGQALYPLNQPNGLLYPRPMDTPRYKTLHIN
uniref:Uncharacterized protein n=1 Tax=Periophthalmus magnuspinnatus TaxID=409849 RepID=A0A3B3ZKX4_9GOBI